MIQREKPLCAKIAFTCLLAIAAFSAFDSPAANVTWDGSEGSDWANPSNWDTSALPADGDLAIIPAGIIDYEYESADNLWALRLNGGELNFAGGLFRATGSSPWDSHVNGNLYHTGTVAEINELEIGRTSGTNGYYSLSGGRLSIVRALAGFSIHIGSNKSNSNAGNGTLEISGGSLTTRSGVKLGDDVLVGTGAFAVLGSLAQEVSLSSAGGDTDPRWEQYSGSTLQVGIDFGGVTPVFLYDSPTSAAGTLATFESGSLLSVDYYNGYEGGGTWTVMEVENGDIVDNGLAFAPGVDTGIWSFNVDNSGPNGLLTVTSNSTAVIRDVYWDGSQDTLWENPLNWTNNFGAFDESYVHIDSGTVDYTTASEAGINLRGFRMTDGVFNIFSGVLEATDLASAFSQMDGTVNQTGGDFGVNALELGSEVSSNARYNLSAGALRIARGRNGYSLYLGSNSNFSNSGSGTLTISGGQFETRTSVKLGDDSASGTGKFVVLGSAAAGIGIASGNNDFDGYWEQHSGSTLQVGIDIGGVTPIFLKDSQSATSGPSAVFANGSLLDVDYYNLNGGGGTWVIMEVENGDIIDNGLSLAPGVDTNIWSFTVDNSGANGRLLVTAVGDPLGHALTIGNTPQQKMRYGMDYERLWFWTGGLNNSERDQIARWSAVDADIDFVRVAINSAYELTEGSYDLSAYTEKIIPLMQEMRQANPNLKFFASPRPLSEAYPSSTNVAWQPYPTWITGSSSLSSNSFNFNWQKCAEYLERYILLMKSYGFKISFLDLTNEWQDATSSGGNRIDTGDARDIANYLKANLEPEDMPQVVTSSSWNYSQGSSWINAHNTSARRNAIDIAGSHNTNRTGDAQTFADTVRNVLGPEKEIWNTEVHGWKSTSNENETTSFYYYLEAIRAGFSGINGWLALGTTNQGHSYILNPNGTPTRNVKYYIYRKLSSTSNYGYALDILQEPSALTIPLGSDDDDIPRTVAAFIKGNLMTVWVINESSNTVPLVITPSGHTIATSSVRRTHWTDPSDVEGFETFEPVASATSFGSTIPGESVCCFEIVVGSEDFANDRIEAEDFSHSWGVGTETSGDVDGDLNLSNVSEGDFARYGAVALTEDSLMTFRVARPNGRPDGIIEIREGSADGALLGQVPVPVTGNWQNYQTIATTLNVEAGIYHLYLKFTEDSTTTGNALFNLNWFSVNEPIIPSSPASLTATAVGTSQINLVWNAVSEATSYTLLRSTSVNGTFSEIASGLTITSSSDSTASVGVPYYYVVRAVNAGGESANSPVATATLPLDAPTGLGATKASASRIDLNWNAVSGATSYNVKRSTTGGGPYLTVVTGLFATSYNDTNSLIPGTRYYYVVSAASSGVESTVSNESSAVPSNPIIPGDVVIDSIELGFDSSGGEQLSASIAKSGLGQFYQVMASDDLQAASWTPASPVHLGTGGLLEIDFPFGYSSHSKHFFRLEAWTE